MFTAGQILFFKPFYFKDGGEPQDKYFVVLKNIESKVVIASLPTSKIKAESLMTIKHGCVNIDERKFNCYVFEKDRRICDNGFSFPRHTYIFGNHVQDYPIAYLTADGKMKLNVDYNVQGVLTKSEFKEIYECVANSNSTINKIRRLLKN